MQTSSISENQVKCLSKEEEAEGAERYCKGRVEESGRGIGMRKRLEVGKAFIRQGSSEACVAALYGGGLMIVGETGALLRNKTREEKRADAFGRDRQEVKCKWAKP